MLQRQPYVGFTLLDERGSTGRAKYSAKRGLTVADMMTGADSLRSHLLSISQCVIVRQSAIYPFFDPAPEPASVGSNTDSVAVFIFTTNTPNQFASITLPGISDQYILQSGPNAGLVVDIDAPVVSTFIEAVTSGLYCNPFGYDIIELAATLIERRP